MKAMRLAQPCSVTRRPLSLCEMPVPKPARGEVLVRVHVCGVCRTDLHEVEGELPMRREGGIVPGHEVVGTVTALGEGVMRLAVGDRVGVGWMHDTCGECAFCHRGFENLCDRARFTGWTVNGGYAEYLTVPESSAYPVAEGLSDEQAAPLMCAGIIGYRALKLSGIRNAGTDSPRSPRLALIGFGGSAHIAIQIARHWGCEVFVITRSDSNRRLATQLGAGWVGAAKDEPPAPVHAAIVFAPAGPLVRTALERLEKGGTVALAGIHMSPIPELDYARHLYGEKCVRSVANATRKDAEELLDLAAAIPIRTSVQSFPLEKADEALIALKTGGITGAAVLRVST